jgi:hypothetical protein
MWEYHELYIIKDDIIKNISGNQAITAIADDVLESSLVSPL